MFDLANVIRMLRPFVGSTHAPKHDTANLFDAAQNASPSTCAMSRSIETDQQTACPFVVPPVNSKRPIMELSGSALTPDDVALNLSATLSACLDVALLATREV